MADGETPNLLNGEEDAPVRRSLGRRKGPKKKKKKVPQRGMGVEKLERHRIQEEWKKMKEINVIASSSPNPHYLHSFHAQMAFPNSDLHFGITHSPHFLPPFSTELSSTPNSLTCNYLHCNACHKKKKVSNSRNLGSEVEDDLAIGNSAGNKGGGEMKKELGSSSSDLQVMEYDFFPHKGDHDDMGMLTSSSSSPSLDLSLKL